MTKKDILFYSFGIIGLVLAMCIIFYEYLFGASWIIGYLEMGIVGLVCITINIGWKTSLARVMSITWVLGGYMVILIEGETMQGLFTQDFLLALIIICINSIAMAIVYLWVTKPVKRSYTVKSF